MLPMNTTEGSSGIDELLTERVINPKNWNSIKPSLKQVDQTGPELDWRSYLQHRFAVTYK
jgi:hypothetical protein